MIDLALREWPRMILVSLEWLTVQVGSQHVTHVVEKWANALVDLVDIIQEVLVQHLLVAE